MLGYLLSTAAFLCLLTASLTLWRRRLSGSGLATALAAQAGWSALLFAQGAGTPVPVGLAVGVEYLRDLAWAWVLVRCLDRTNRSRAAYLTRRGVSALIVLIALGAGASLLSGWPTPLERFIGRYWLWGGLALSIGGLVLVEQVARNTRSARLWSLKHIWLAIGGLYAWDLCLYSVTMLRGSAAPEFWAVRGYVDVLLGGLLAVGLSRVTDWESAAFLSPRMVFFNATLLATSAYVLVLAVGSYFVRRLGGTWGGAGQILLLAAGALVLAVAVLSEQFRAWSRVIIAKNFFPYRYDYRNEWQKLTRALSRSDETSIYERIASVMAGMVSCSSGGLWLRDPEGTYVPVGGELAPPGAPHEAGSREFLGYLLEKEWIYDLEEARDSVGVRKPSALKSVRPPPPVWMLETARLWLVIPLICESTLVGFVGIGQPLAPMRLEWEEIDLLRAAGRQVASFLAFEQAAKRLAEAHQFEAMNRLSAVLMHDLRHLIAQQALVVQNAARHRGNPEFFDDAIMTIDNSVKRMNRLMDELRSGVLTMETQRIALAELCAEAVKRCASREPAPHLEVHDRAVEVVLNRDRLLQVLEHVIRNAQDATPREGTVMVHVRRLGERAIIEMVDTGTGMDAQFIRTRLFKPFDTTKGDRGFGIGAFEAREFVRKCGGDVHVQSTPGKGTRFAISLPTAPVLAPVESVPAHAS